MEHQIKGEDMLPEGEPFAAWWSLAQNPPLPPFSGPQSSRPFFSQPVGEPASLILTGPHPVQEGEQYGQQIPNQPPAKRPRAQPGTSRRSQQQQQQHLPPPPPHPSQHTTLRWLLPRSDIGVDWGQTMNSLSIECQHMTPTQRAEWYSCVQHWHQRAQMVYTALSHSEHLLLPAPAPAPTTWGQPIYSGMAVMSSSLQPLSQEQERELFGMAEAGPATLAMPEDEGAVLDDKIKRARLMAVARRAHWRRDIELTALALDIVEKEERDYFVAEAAARDARRETY